MYQAASVGTALKCINSNGNFEEVVHFIVHKCEVGTGSMTAHMTCVDFNSGILHRFS